MKYCEIHERIDMKYKVVTLCGSSRFQEDFLRLQKELTLTGNVVLSLPFFSHVDGKELFNRTSTENFGFLKKMLDEMHRQKIDMADEIFVVNVDGYVGESTKKEIEYAQSQNKPIKYLFPAEKI